LIAYDTADARAIMGLKSSHIAAVLGYDGRSELIHRDMLVVRAG
ncbi:MAG: glutamate 5-kinase, partial [Pseudomonadota bacterium]